MLIVSTATNYLMNFVIGQITPVMLDNITYGTYFFFFATNVCCNLIIYFFYPGNIGSNEYACNRNLRGKSFAFSETKNRTLEEMEILFGGEEAEQIAKVAERKHGVNVLTEDAQEKVEEDALPSNSSKEEIPEQSTKDTAA